MMLKPPPPCPSRLPVPKATQSIVTSFKQVNTYQLPMASDYVPAWVRVLQQCGYPTQVVVLDFETYFDAEYSLKLMSTPEYILDKRFEVLGLARVQMDGQYPFGDYQANSVMEVGAERVERYLRYLQAIYGPALEGCTIVMQNAGFDASVLAWHYGIFPKFIVDTKCLAAAWNTRSKHDLGHMATTFGLPDKGETKDFLACTMRKRYFRPKIRGKAQAPQVRPVMTDDQVKALCGYADNDVMREWEVFTILLPMLSNPKIELAVQHHTLELFTRPVLKLDVAKANELIVGMEAEIDAIIAPTSLTREEISGDKSFEWALSERLRAIGENPQTYMKVCKRGMMLALAKDDPERKLLAAHTDETVRNLIAARGALDSWPLHIKRVRRLLSMAAACGGLLPVPLNYWGAHTGRWSGGQKLNLQNLPKRGHPLVVAMRGLLIAPEGYVLAIVDLAAIEARVLAWIAGQWDLIEKFANREEIYCGFAAKVLGWAVRKPKKDGIPAIEARHTWARNNIGKIGILGCGYGMGPKEPGNPTSPNYFFRDAGLDLAMAERIVSVYRESNTAITGFWRAIEKAFSYTAKYKRPCAMERGLTFHSTDKIDVVITLPNGRELHYHKVRINAALRSEQISVFNEMEHKWDYLWGGTLTENVVQAMSRDVLIEAGMRLEGMGYHTAFHCHDELLLVVPAAQGERCLEDTITEMSKTPVWATRLPLAAEGWIGDRYGK